MVMVRRVEEVEGRVQGGVELLEEERRREEREYGRLQGLLPHYRWKIVIICPQMH